MLKETQPTASPLLPDRHPQPDFFLCDIFDAAPKGDMASMEHPIFSLSTKPDRRIRRYEHNGLYVEIQPSALGLATIFDRDVLIYCISQLVAGLNENREVSQVVKFKAFDLLTATNRPTAGTGYEGLKAAFERLGGTREFRINRVVEDRPGNSRWANAGGTDQTVRLGVQCDPTKGGADATS
jgi:plasmid replication initiation protein